MIPDTLTARLRARLARLTAPEVFKLYTRGLIRFYNLDNYRGRETVDEIRALLEDRPLLLGVCEVHGNELPRLTGYTLVRDRSTRSRANIAAYVRHDVPLEGIDWLDLHGTWPRTNPGAAGIHEARSYLLLTLGRVPVVIWHQPPKNAHESWRLQWEGVNAVVRVVAPWRVKAWRQDRTRVRRRLTKLRPWLVLGDGNRRKGETGPGPDALADMAGGEVYGPWVDQLTAGGQVKVTDARKFGRIDGEPLDSDHKGAVSYQVAIPTWWLKLVPRG